MSRIKVNTQNLDNWAELLKDCGEILDDVAVQLQRSHDSMPDSCLQVVGDSIERRKQELNRVKRACEATVSSLRKTAELFETCEEEVMESFPGMGTEGTVLANVWNSPWLSWLDSTLDFLNICEYGRDYEDPGAARQRARDELMQEEIEEIFQDEDLNEAAWKKASAKEKQEIMNEILKRINRIQGTDVNTKVRYFTEQPDGAGIFTAGYYRDFGKTVHMNTFYLENFSYSAVMNTLTHEMRHGYQHAVIKNPDGFDVSESTAKAWDKNFDRYISYEEKKNNYQQYRNQPVEADANDFADGVDYE